MNSTTATIAARVLISVIAIAGYGVIVGLILSADLHITPELERLLIFVLGALTTSVVTIVNYWFSSSQSSSEKNEMLLRASPGATQ